MWATPQDFFDKLDAEFNFTVDVCATAENAKCSVWIGPPKKVDSLQVGWYQFTGTLWMNPPYGREINKWVQKASEESQKGAVIVSLLPARTDTRWWHRYIWDAEKNEPRLGVEVRFIQGRLKFGDGKNPAPFPSAVVIFRPIQTVCKYCGDTHAVYWKVGVCLDCALAHGDDK